MAATSPPAGGGNFFTRKLGPFPMWVWIGVGVAVLYIYESRKAASSGTASSTAAQTALAQQGAAAAQYGYSGADLASMLSQIEGQVSLLGAGNNGTTSSGATSPGSTGTPAAPAAPNYASEKLSGSGYYVPGSVAPITGANGHTYEWIPSGAVIGSLPKGTIVYYQPVPGQFTSTGPVGTTQQGTHQGQLAPGTPTFLQVS